MATVDGSLTTLSECKSQVTFRTCINHVHTYILRTKDVGNSTTSSMAAVQKFGVICSKLKV